MTRNAMTYAEACAERDRLEAAWKEAVAARRAISGSGSGSTGLTPDAVKARPEWQAAHAAMQRAHLTLAGFNAWFVSAFKAEERARRRREAEMRNATLSSL